MNVTIVTKSLHHSLQIRSGGSGSGSSSESRTDTSNSNSSKTLHVYLTTENKSIRPLVQCNCKLYMNAKILRELKGKDVINSRERCEVYHQDTVLLSITEYPDNAESLPLTDGVIYAIFLVFEGMHRCEQIIIYSQKGQNRSPLIGARLAALISIGKNEPGIEAFEYFLHICKHVNENFDSNLMNTWPNLCTNTWTQRALCVFERSEGKKYPGGGEGINVQFPEGKLTCVYNDYDSDKTIPFDVESILVCQDNYSNGDDLSEDDESFFTANEEDGRETEEVEEEQNL